MEYIISFARKADEEGVRRLLSEHKMGMLGEVEDYVVLKSAGEVCAVGRLVQTGKDYFHLEVFGVKNGLRRKGVGGLLLSKIISSPGEYCRCASIVPGAYKVTTVARGEAASFYIKHGFRPCSFSNLASPYDVQCDDCPDRGTCRPLPMMFEGC
ncbi:MAG: GNAT family N-acetyltransferase [Firmicutes bacterium]|nr:GNAT family N-acetyltransferase [Bacillota bacterium]